jgi:hypothetical protein
MAMVLLYYKAKPPSTTPQPDGVAGCGHEPVAVLIKTALELVKQVAVAPL